MFLEALAIVITLFIEHPFLTAIVVIALEVPRYTFSIFAIGLTRLFARPPSQTSDKRVSVIVPSFNGGADLFATLTSLLNQQQPLHEIIVVDDGSTDGTGKLLDDFVAKHPNIRLLRHNQRAGKSPSVNHAARIATGELLLVIDHDTVLEANGCARLAQAFEDPDVALASGNLLVANRTSNPLTALQSLEYMLAITIGRGFLNQVNAVGCCSGAFSMFRTDAFKSVGGMNVGPGEDLEITLRLRQAGYQVRFVESALASTRVPENATGLFKQRLRWDGDAVATRLLMYRELSAFNKNESFADTLQRLDYVFLDLLPTIVFPFYLGMLWLDYGSNIVEVLTAIYVVLFWLYVFNILMAIIITKRALSWLDLLVLPIMPLYQGVVMRLARFIAISDEVLLARSQHDPLVPKQVRQALYGDSSNE